MQYWQSRGHWPFPVDILKGIDACCTHTHTHTDTCTHVCTHTQTHTYTIDIQLFIQVIFLGRVC